MTEVYDRVLTRMHNAAKQTRHDFERAKPSESELEKLTPAERISISQLVETGDKGFEAAEVLVQNNVSSTAITRGFVRTYSKSYDRHASTQDAEDEAEVLRWLVSVGEPKYLNKAMFVKAAIWKTGRQKGNYLRNDALLVEEATRIAYLASNELLKLHVLRVLRGVSTAVAGTLLYFLHPESFPIFDYHARAALKSAGLWAREINDASDDAWIEFVKTSRDLANQIGVGLRDLDKALFAYDKWGSDSNI